MVINAEHGVGGFDDCWDFWNCWKIKTWVRLIVKAGEGQASSIASVT